MKPPCNIVVTYVLPAVRAVVARRLIEHYGLKPSKVAARMGVTAAAITQYEKSARGAAFIEALNRSERISNAIDDLTKSVKDENYFIDELIRKLCDICTIARSERLICALHKDELSGLRDFKCEVCEQERVKPC